MFVAHHLITVDKVFTIKLSGTPPPDSGASPSGSGAPPTGSATLQACAGVCRLADLIPRVRRLGNDALNEHVGVKREELCDQLIAAEGSSFCLGCGC